MDEKSQTLGSIIKQCRKAAGLTQRELAARLDIVTPFLSDIEAGNRFPSREKLAEIAKALGVDAAKLQAYDHRDTVDEVRSFLTENPSYAVAFRTVVTTAAKKKLSPQELAKRIAKG